MTAYEARVMHHPHARKGKITEIKGNDPVTGRPFTDSQGEPDMFPEITVKDATTEAYYRSRGYLFAGEVPNPPAEYAEYPVMLSHPKHKDAIADDWHVEKGDNNEIIRHKIPGKPEEFPPRQASNATEEKALNKQGYRRAALDNPEAIRKAKASPYNPNAKIEEFPKMVGAEIVDPNAPTGGPQEYPKWVGDREVKNRAEEEALTGKKVEAAPQAQRPPLRQGGITKAKTSAPKGVKSAKSAPVPAAASSAPVLADGLAPLRETARQKRAREAGETQKPATTLRGSPPQG